MNTPDIDAVTALVQEAARTLVLPRFRQLSDEHVERKPTPGDPHDIVTIVDREVEAWLTAALREVAPDSAMIGEEAVYRQPDLLDLVQTDRPAWILDPIDGTKTFARGDEGFGIMLAWVAGGQARAGWVLLPALNQMFVAEAGGGLTVNGRPTTIPPTPAAGPPVGTLHVRYMPPPVRDLVERAAAGRFRAAGASGCAAVEYTEIVRGERAFSIYYRLRPWDHAAPALILTEGGGRAVHLDSTPYAVRSPDQVTIVAADAAVAEDVRRWFPAAAG